MGTETAADDLRRGVPRMSPSLLSKRLKELVEAGVITAEPGQEGVTEYKLTAAGRRALESYLSHMESLIRQVRNR